MDIGSVIQCIRDVKAAKAKLHAKIMEVFPIGGDVHWDKGGHRQHGVVTAHSPGSGRLCVQNERTGARYWITMYDVLGYVS